MKHRSLRWFSYLPVLILAACTLSSPTTEVPRVTPPNPPEADKATVVGRVVDADTNEPLSSTLIKLAEVYGEGDEGAYVLDTYFSPGATTDENGYFIMENVPAIGYVVVVGDVFYIYSIIQTEEGKPKVWKTSPGEVLDLGTLLVSLQTESVATPSP